MIHLFKLSFQNRIFELYTELHVLAIWSSAQFHLGARTNSSDLKSRLVLIFELLHRTRKYIEQYMGLQSIFVR